jgi:hydrogenase-4 component B
LIPSVLAASYDPGFIARYIVDMNFWNLQDLGGSVIVYILGFMMFFVGFRFHLFHLKLPKWMNAERYIYTPVTIVCEKIPEFCVTKFEKPIIFGDTLIYALILSVIMGALLLSRLFF